MECARSPSWLAPSSADHVHYQRIHSNAVPDTIRLVLDGSDLVLFTASPATSTGLPVLQADISTIHNRMHCCSLHNFKTTKNHRARTAATNALIARKWLKRASGQYFTSHNNDDNNSNNGNGSNHSAGAADSSHGQDRNSSQQGSGSEQGSKDGDNTDKDNGGNGASSDGAGGGSNGNDDDDNRDNHRPRKSAHPDNNNDEEDDSDVEQEGDDSHSGQQASQYSIKADLDRKDVNDRSQQQPTPVDLTKENGTSTTNTSTAVKQERIAVDADTDTERDHPASTSITARVPLPSSAPRSGDSRSRESIAPQQQYHQPSRPGSGSSAAPSPQASTEASVSPQNKTPTSQLESNSNPAQNTPKPCKTAHKPTQKTVQNPTVQTTSPQARRPQPPLFTESPTSRSPQDPRPQQRRPLPQARPVQLGTPLQSPIITIQNVDKNETPHLLPSQAHTPQRSPHTRSPHQASPHQLSPHQTGRSPRRPLPQSRGGSRQPLSLAKPSPTSAEGLRIMPVATGSTEADPTDPCTANDVASFDMFWERALELLRRDNNKKAAGPQQQDQPPTRPVQVKQQALPEPTPNKGPVPMDIDEQPADVQDTQPQVHQQPPQQQNQRQLRPQMQPLAQPNIQPRPQPQRQEPTANIQHTERQFIVHVGPGLTASRPDRRKYCQSFYEESAEEEAARKKAKEDRQRERLERQMIEEEENRRQRLQLHQQRIQQQVLKQQMHEQEISLRRQQQQQHKQHKQQQKGLDQHGKDQELRRQLAEQFKQQQLLEEERQRQIGDMDYYNRYLARKPPLQMLSELEEEERKQREQQQQDEMHSEQFLEEGNYRHDDPPRQSGSRTWPLERPGPLLQRPGPLLHQSAPLERPGPLLKQHAPLERPGPLLESSRDDQSSRPAISGSSARSTGRTTRITRPIRPIRPIRSAHSARPARPARPIHIAPASSMPTAITQPLQLIATREGTVMSVDDYRDAHRRAVIEAREHLRRLEETDPLLPIERPDLIAQRTLPAAPPTLASYTIPTTGDSAVPRSFKKVVAPCPCCNQYLKGYRDEGAPAVGEAAPRNA